MNSTAEFLRQQIQRFGPLTFADFMQHALYLPDSGYYENEDTIGREGDFYTSVSVGPAFGQLLAFQFARWVEAQAQRSIEFFDIVEAGAHNGQLAHDVLSALQRFHPALYSQACYWLVEPSEKRRVSQRETLRRFDSVTRWVADLSQLGTEAGFIKRRFRIIFSNELLDALPVHLVRWKAGFQQFVELGVDWQDDRFVWKELPGVEVMTERPVSAKTGKEEICLVIRDMLGSQNAAALMKIIPDGFTLEIPVAAIRWWRDAGALVSEGKLITFDYGFAGDDLRPGNPSGSLRGFHRHHLAENILDRPGEIDITSHVNFSALIRTGEQAGFATESFSSQELFLSRVAAARMAAGFPDWGGKEKRQFLTLVHPDHLGASFKTLIQSKASG